MEAIKTMQAVKNKKGFTLIEIIVVLVIIAILAAASIPTMMGFVEDARAKSLVTNARTAYIAAQAICSEYLALNAEIPYNDANFMFTDNSTQSALTRFRNMLEPDIIPGSVIGSDNGNGHKINCDIRFTTGTNGVETLVYMAEINSVPYYVTLVSGQPVGTQKGGSWPDLDATSSGGSGS